jgi:hypothetical protein
LTALTPLRCSIEYSSTDAWPTDSTNRSRLAHTGSSGSNRRWRCHNVYVRGANAIAVPGCPELAPWTASIDRVRMVLMVSWSIGWAARSVSGWVPAVIAAVLLA